MKITARDLETLVENIYTQVESEIGITRWQFVQIAKCGRGNANQVAKNPTLKTIVKLIETRDKLLSDKKKGLYPATNKKVLDNRNK